MCSWVGDGATNDFDRFDESMIERLRADGRFSFCFKILKLNL
jgi:hypothetical protein